MQTTLRFRTNLNCGRCVEAVRPHLDEVPGILDWDVDTEDPERVLSVSGTGVAVHDVEKAVSSAGFRVLGRIDDPSQAVLTDLPDSSSGQTQPATMPDAASADNETYYPLILLIGFLLGIIAIIELRMGTWQMYRAMQHFMGAFFTAFAFFKLLDLKGFAESWRMYDIVAERIPQYGYVYPFIELGLGISYLLNVWPLMVNVVTLIVMSVSIVGVIRSLMQQRKIRCACLGTVFNLPMSKVTLAEDALMILMAGAALLALVA